MEMNVIIAILCVFIGCCSNVVFLEYIVKYDPGSGNLVTFLQFLFIAFEGFINTSKFGTVKPKISLSDYSILVTFFFIASFCNNYAFDFNIPMPLHMIFRSGSLIANMIMGIIILNRRYEKSKYISVAMITIGIILCTIVSGSDIKSNSKLDDDKENDDLVFFWWINGIALLTIALFVSARMGLYQETLHQKYGKQPKEALYYTHLLPLPFFFFASNNLWDHIKIANASEPYPALGFNIPTLWLYLIAAIITQYMCIKYVYVLTTECSSLTVTLILTIRKFVSLLFSIVYFNNSFTTLHWVGTSLVFTGTVIFFDLISKTKEVFSKKISTEEMVKVKKVN